MDNPISKEQMLKIAQEATVKPVFLFYHCRPKEGKKYHRFLLLDLISTAAKETGLTIEIKP
jgi:hypothetical protein